MASPHLSIRHNATMHLGNMCTFDYWNRPTNQAFHNLTTVLTPPPNLRSLLGLGLKFIPTPLKPNTFNSVNKPNTGIPLLVRSLRLRCFFCATGSPEPDAEHIPKLHVPSDWEPPPQFFPKILNQRIANFEIKMHSLFRQRKAIPNLSKAHRHSLNYLRLQQEFIIAHCDKNLGPAIIERTRYIQLAFDDHLSDTSTYQQLSCTEAEEYAEANRLRLHNWLKNHKEELTSQEHNFVLHHFTKVTDPLPYFYLLMKVHKSPLKTRPIVSFSGSLFHSLGVWVDTHLQAVAKSFPSYIESSFDLLHDLNTINLPPGCRLFTSDAKSMYTNIDTDAAITSIRDYIIANQAKFPLLPVTPLIEALGLIMRHNVFQFGDTAWKQLSGTAMGAPPAPTYANASFATHEDAFLPAYSNHLAYYKRYIDDVFGIWIPDSDSQIDATQWLAFQHDLNNWHGLRWVTNPPSNQVVFLDVILQLEDSQISSRIYEKPMNLHLHLPARSAHPPGVLHGLIAGHICRSFSLCSDPNDALASIQNIYRFLRARGYSSNTLRPIFNKCLEKSSRIYAPAPALDTSDIHPRMWFFKLVYHPQDPPSGLIRKTWEETIASPRLSKPLEDIDLNFTPIGKRRFIVCYKRAPNLGNLLSYRKLQPTSGPPVSSFVDD